ncbi:hypothetical protein COS53_02955 [Candidatus Shapirobacteria bacterium CG03_land_8_20_14_0_80_35_14]|uniref:Uncharacterized protein n=1 Tax=Candidatus Shapirobacteria bacterium CG03_land_8_20_14_0_80_35_14 TaxID=1974878 RepID=A0A2M7BNZ9_9BACT|nr:MAG: hypothetical protein COS53_02955 [Candidatus Shapirobacteria bacterium CG03_land_8_20_14_0_80_35_14]
MQLVSKNAMNIQYLDQPMFVEVMRLIPINVTAMVKLTALILQVSVPLVVALRLRLLQTCLQVHPIILSTRVVMLTASATY